MLLMDAVAAYLADAAAANLSTRTLKTYGAWLRRMGRWLGAESTTTDLSPVACKRFMQSLAVRPRTAKCCLHALRAFGAWGEDNGLYKDNPAANIKPPKLDPVQREVCTDTEVADVLAACDRLPDARRAAMALAVLTILVHAGLRRAELLALKLADVSLTTRSIEIRHGKGDKARRAYPHADCIEALRAWLRVRGNCRHDFLFDYDGARKLGDVGLRSLLREVYAVAGYRDCKRLLPHSLRHNYATRLLRATGDLETVRAALGHDSLTTTMVYLHTDEQRLRQVAEMTTITQAVVRPMADRPAEKQPERAAAWRQRVRVRQ